MAQKQSHHVAFMVTGQGADLARTPPLVTIQLNAGASHTNTSHTIEIDQIGINPDPDPDLLQDLDVTDLLQDLDVTGLQDLDVTGHQDLDRTIETIGLIETLEAIGLGQSETIDPQGGTMEAGLSVGLTTEIGRLVAIREPLKALGTRF